MSNLKEKIIMMKITFKISLKNLKKKKSIGKA